MDLIRSFRRIITIIERERDRDHRLNISQAKQTTLAWATGVRTVISVDGDTMPSHRGTRQRNCTRFHSAMRRRNHNSLSHRNRVACPPLAANFPNGSALQNAWMHWFKPHLFASQTRSIETHWSTKIQFSPMRTILRRGVQWQKCHLGAVQVWTVQRVMRSVGVIPSTTTVKWKMKIEIWANCIARSAAVSSRCSKRIWVSAKSINWVPVIQVWVCAANRRTTGCCWVSSIWSTAITVRRCCTVARVGTRPVNRIWARYRPSIDGRVNYGCEWREENQIPASDPAKRKCLFLLFIRR